MTVVPPVADVVMFGLALALPIGLYGLYQAVARVGSKGEGGQLSVILSPGSAAAVSGIVIGVTAMPVTAQVIDDFASLSVLFVSAWCGFAIGCGIDLRVLRRTSSVLLASQLGQCIVAMSVIPVVAYGLARVGGGETRAALLSPGALLIAAGMCLSGGASPGRGGQDQGFRPGGMSSGFPKPSIAALVAILLASMGGGLDPVGGNYPVALPFLSMPSFSLSISGVAERVLMGLCMGCIAGLLCDLASKDHSSAGFTFSVLAAVLLAVGGVAVAFGVQPLLVGITGGAWLINATLRRLDVQRVVERSYGISSIGVPLLAGWFLGHGIVTYGFSRESFVVGLALILVIRPLIRVAGWRLGEHLIKAKNPQALSREGESLPFDNTGFVIALVLMMAAPGAAAIGFLAAALLAQIAFGGISRWLLRPAAVAQTRATTWSPRDS